MQELQDKIAAADIPLAASLQILLQLDDGKFKMAENSDSRMTQAKKILFVTGDLRAGRGVEYFVYYAVTRLKDRDFHASVLQGLTVVPYHRMDKKEYQEIERVADIYEFTDYLPNFYWMSRSGVGNIAMRIMVGPILALFSRGLLDEKARNAVSESDIIYLTGNTSNLMFSKRKHQVGSCHTLAIRGNSWLSRIVRASVRRFRIWPNISSFHFFPGCLGILKSYENVPYFEVPLGVDTTLFFPRSSAHAKIRFMFAGAIDRGKGSLVALDAFLLLPEEIRDVSEIHIAGTGPIFEKIKQRASKNVIVHGRMERKDMADLYGRCDVFVYPTEYDTFSFTVLEALSSGLHVITTPVLAGIWDEEESKGYVEYVLRDASSFSSRMKDCVTNISILRDKKPLIHEYIEEKYDWTHVIAEFYEGLRSVYGRKV